MRILIAHVRYRQRGGEDAIVDTEAALLHEAGHDVALLDPSSSAFDALAFGTRLRIGLSAGDHPYGRALIREAVDVHRPDVVHFHNLYPLLGPGALDEATQRGCGTVQTMHNYRLTCVAGTHFRSGNTCEECSALRHGAGVRNACYRGSSIQSLVMARGLSRQWRLAAEGQAPDILICLTDFMRDRLTRAGIRADMLMLKPNSVAGPSVRKGYAERAGVVFVGRLSPEKGIRELVCRWPVNGPSLSVIGTGPLEAELRTIAGENVLIVGAAQPSDVREALSRARVGLISSTCAEGLPTVALECFAEGTPVVGFNHGGVGSLLAQQGPGMAVEFLDWVGLIGAALRWSSMSQTEWDRRSEAAAAAHKTRYTDSMNLSALGSIYAAALERRSERHARNVL